MYCSAKTPLKLVIFVKDKVADDAKINLRHTLNHYKSASNFPGQFNQFQENKEKLEHIVNDYIQTGTATRKFDGFSVRFEQDKIKCSYNSGLNATHTIKFTPLEHKIDIAQGDVNDPSCDIDLESNKGE